MSEEIRYHVWYKEDELGCTVENDTYGYEDYEYAKKEFEDEKENHEWVRLEKVTTEILETYQEPYPFEYREKVKVIKKGILYHAEGIVRRYNKREQNVTVYFEDDDLMIDFGVNEIVKMYEE